MEAPILALGLAWIVSLTTFVVSLIAIAIAAILH